MEQSKEEILKFYQDIDSFKSTEESAFNLGLLTSIVRKKYERLCYEIKNKSPESVVYHQIKKCQQEIRGGLILLEHSKKMEKIDGEWAEKIRGYFENYQELLVAVKDYADSGFTMKIPKLEESMETVFLFDLSESLPPTKIDR